MRNAEHPRFRVGERASLVERLDHFQQRFLNQILTVDDRAGHARAVSMQLRPQFGEKPVERLACGRRIERCTHSALSLAAIEGCSSSVT